MPWRRDLYPIDWKERVRQVRKRASDRCEFVMANGERCPAENHLWIHRGIADPEQFVECAADGLFCSGRDVDEAPMRVQQRPIRVVLTTSHNDSVGPKDCALDELSSLCQLHHLRHDCDQHVASAAATRRKKRQAAGQLALEMA